MSKVLTDPKHYTDIADAIRAHLGVETTYLPSEMAAAIGTIPDGANVATGSFTVAQSSSYTVSGIPFTPTGIIVAAESFGFSSIYFPLYANTISGSSWGVDYSGDDMVLATGNNFKAVITITSDGFTIKANYQHLCAGKHFWIAIKQ